MQKKSTDLLCALSRSYTRLLFVQNFPNCRAVLFFQADMLLISLQQLRQAGVRASGIERADIVLLAAERRFVDPAAGLAALDKARFPDRPFFQHAVEKDVHGTVHPALVLGQGQDLTARKRSPFLPQDIHDFDFIFCQVHDIPSFQGSGQTAFAHTRWG